MMPALIMRYAVLQLEPTKRTSTWFPTSPPYEIPYISIQSLTCKK